MSILNLNIDIKRHTRRDKLLMMESYLTLINFLFIPMISLYVYFKLAKISIKFSLETILLYATFTCLDVVLARIVLVPIKFFFKLNFLMTGGTYTFIAIPVAVLSGFLIEFFKKYFSANIKVIERESDEKEKR